MRPRLHIDFETRSAADLKKVGADAYAKHSSTDVWCMGYRFDGRDVECWVPGDDASEILEHVRLGYTVVAHNAAFEMAIWRHVMTERYGWPELRLEQGDCTMARALACGLPGALEDLAPALRLAVRKDDEGKRLMMRMARPRRTADDGSHVWWDDPERLARLIEYCRNDVAVECEIDAALPHLSTAERVVWMADQRINRRGVQLDINAADNLSLLVRHAVDSLDAELSAITGGAVPTATALPAMRAWLSSHGVPSDALAKADVTALLETVTGPAKRVLEIRQEAGKASTAKIRAAIRAACPDGRLRGMFQYSGAPATRRWAGRRVQLQNLPRPKLPPHQLVNARAMLDCDATTELVADLWRHWIGGAMDVAPSLLRSLLVSAPGKTLVGLDYANIEGRVAAWLAVEVWKLEAFRAYDAGAGPDLYKVAYARSFRLDPNSIAKDSEERQIGKVMELALGYGGGYGAFASMAKNYGVRVLEQGEVSDDSAALSYDRVLEIRDAWRAAHPSIVAYWKQLESAAIEAVRNGGKAAVHAGPISYRMARLGPNCDTLLCRLPSGGTLSYVDAKVEMRPKFGELRPTLLYMGMSSDPGKPRVWCEQSAYSGLLFENCCQAVARDLLAGALVRADARGLPVVLHVHDALAAEVDERDDTALDRLTATALELPPWATGLPLAVDTWQGKHFLK